MYFHEILVRNRSLIFFSAQFESFEITVTAFLEKFSELILLILRPMFYRHWFTARTISHKNISFPFIGRDIKRISALTVPANWVTQFLMKTPFLTGKTKTKSLASIPYVLNSSISCSQHNCRTANSSNSD